MTKRCVKRGTRFLHKPISHLIYNRYCIRYIDNIKLILYVCMYVYIYIYIYIFIVHAQYMGSWSRMANNHQACRTAPHPFSVSTEIGFPKVWAAGSAQKTWLVLRDSFDPLGPAVVQKNTWSPPKPKDMLEFGFSPWILSGIILIIIPKADLGSNGLPFQHQRHFGRSVGVAA